MRLRSSLAAEPEESVRKIAAILAPLRLDIEDIEEVEMEHADDDDVRERALTPRGGAGQALARSGGTKRRRRDSQDTEGGGSASCTQCRLTVAEKCDFFEVLREFYDKELLCDVTLIVGDKHLKAHKSVLMGYRSFLGALMTTNMREGSQTEIELKEEDPELFKIVLDYMYGKAFDVPNSDVIPLLGLATRHQVVGLRTQLCDILMQGLDAENSTIVYAAADLHACVELRALAFSKIVSSFALASRTEGFNALEERLLVEVLGSDMVLDCDESVVFDAAVRWLDVSPARMERAHYVLSLVRFPNMDAGLLSDVIKFAPIMSQPLCSAYLVEAWEHQALVASGRSGKPDCPRTRPRRRSCSFKSHTLLMEHSDAVSALCVFENLLISGSWDTTIKVWNPKTWQCERTLSDHTGTVRCFATCAGMVVSGSDDCTIKVWNPETWTLVRTLADQNGAVNAVTECSGRLASGSDEGTIKLWNIGTWVCEVTIHQSDNPCGVLSLTMCGGKLVSGSDEAIIKVWNTQNWTCEQVIRDHTDEVWCLVSINDRLISGSTDSTIRVWDTETWQCEKVMTEHNGAIYATTIMDGKLVSASSDETIRVWNSDWECERVLPYGGAWALAIYNPEGKEGEDRLVSGSLDKSVKVWGT